MQAALNTAIMLVDVSYPKWRILFCNVQVDKATGLSGSEISGQHVWDHFTVVGKTEVGSLPTLSVCLSVPPAVSFGTPADVCLSVCLFDHDSFLQMIHHVSVIALRLLKQMLDAGACRQDVNLQRTLFVQHCLH